VFGVSGMLTLLFSTSLVALGICGVLIIGATEHTVPIKIEDANAMWTLHKLNSGCDCKKHRLLSQKKGKTIGFMCECGYKYTQKKPLIS
jgi:hypothetical protein